MRITLYDAPNEAERRRVLGFEKDRLKRQS
jgi:hypothetical protein